MRKFVLFVVMMCPLNVLAEGLPASLPVNQSIFQPETTRPLYNIERNTYTNSAIQKMVIPEEAPKEPAREVQPVQEKGLKGLFKGFTVEW